jgi:hypothetical protein
MISYPRAIRRSFIVTLFQADFFESSSIFWACAHLYIFKLYLRICLGGHRSL